ncbi:MAG: two-component system, chemotaxis family, protein-glutamate methylesterase/glutaminase [Micromonosporaceae bacterium]|jgi:two-component system chemotaxis response regulator CheB|nr:two-component system, chemotaxis family, protein-glutamate methylesterase/glutaminase [Micromonosporaceae bacterium]
MTAAGSDVEVYPVNFPVVALVASSGGLSVLIRILSLLPPDIPASLLVSLHQQPDRPSELAGLLAGHAALPVRPAGDGDHLDVGKVLVVPPGRHLIVTSAATIGLLPTGAAPPSRPSADLLLATLAVTCGPHALGVVLSGYGHDGQAGVRAIVRCGGTVLAQDRGSSPQFGMPGAAIDTNLVRDIDILPPEGIAAAITAHAHGQRPPPA